MQGLGGSECERNAPCCYRASAVGDKPDNGNTLSRKEYERYGQW
ncbi:hypothetical protein [Duncaniella sp.]|nr:hypothetical protein [Duncaniella sp.]MCX4284925.1 hypothetical protein [Duncaniella dubosii]